MASFRVEWVKGHCAVRTDNDVRGQENSDTVSTRL